MEGFDASTVRTSQSGIFLRRGGRGSAVLLLHGFPETHLMWREVAPLLSNRHTVVCADLPGYGQSRCTLAGDAPQSKRHMARQLVEAMHALGHARFSVVGHDRGARVAYRMALDHPTVVERVAVLDILPTLATWALAGAEFALAYWPWSFLAQQAPLPERALAAAAEAVVDDALHHWGTPPHVFPPHVRAAYVRMLQDPAQAHAICEDYRAAAGVDREHDQADLDAGRRIQCPLLAIWSARGPLGRWSAAHGGPARVWQQWAAQVEGCAIQGGHFFPEELPRETAERLGTFLALR
jgi:haloacetate dehalogenase